MREEGRKKGISTGTGLVIGIAVIYILFGLAKLLIPNFEETYIIYIAGAILVACGIVLIVHYFMSGNFRDIGKYGFSGGVLGVLAGICILLRATQIASYFHLFLGVCILLTAIIKLQNAVDLKSIENRTWLVFLIIAIAFLVAALVAILNPGGIMSSNKNYIYYILVADGAVNIVSTIYLAIAIRTSGKKKEKINLSEEAEKPAEDVTFSERWEMNTPKQTMEIAENMESTQTIENVSNLEFAESPEENPISDADVVMDQQDEVQEESV